MTTIYLLTYDAQDYESSATTIDVFLDREVAEANLAVCEAAEREGGRWWIEETVPETRVRIHTAWWEASASRSASRPEIVVSSWERQEVDFAPAVIQTRVIIRKLNDQVENPGYVRDTPNARHVNTPGGRYLSNPSVYAVAQNAVREVAERTVIEALESFSEPLPAVGEVWS